MPVLRKSILKGIKKIKKLNILVCFLYTIQAPFIYNFLLEFQIFRFIGFLNFKNLKKYFSNSVIACLASFNQTFAYNDASASFMFEIACNSFLPYFDIKIILASHKGFCKFFGINSNAIFTKFSPNLCSSFSNAA